MTPCTSQGRSGSAGPFGALGHRPNRGDRITVSIAGSDDPHPPPPPMALQIELTSRCNLRCRMCPLTTGTSSTSSSPGPMRDVVFDEVLEIARRCRQVIIAGYGEPFTNPECMPLLRALDRAGINISLATNGIGLKPAIAEELVGLRQISLINVSIDSPDPEVYAQLRRGSLARALQGLRNLMSVIDDPDRVTVSSVAMDSNIGTLDAFPPLLAGLGVRRFSLQAVMDYNDYAAQHTLLDQPGVEQSIERLRQACAANGVELELSVPERTTADYEDPSWARKHFYGLSGWDPATTRQCHVPWEIPFIDKDGRVFACCFAASAGERPFGRLGEQSFDDLWTGPVARRFRADLVHGATTPQICRKCSVAPLGQHLFERFAGRVEWAAVRNRTRRTASVSVGLRNHSGSTWTSDDHIRVGTSAPRDGGSLFAIGEWLAPNRPTAMQQARVEPGEVATFEFTVSMPLLGPRVGEFELVAEGRCWLPNSRMILRASGRDLKVLGAGLRLMASRRGRFLTSCWRRLPPNLRSRIRQAAA